MAHAVDGDIEAFMAGAAITPPEVEAGVRAVVGELRTLVDVHALLGVVGRRPAGNGYSYKLLKLYICVTLATQAFSSLYNGLTVQICQ